jgi:hypothetical protein
LQRVHYLPFERILVIRDKRPDILFVEERGMLPKVLLPMELLFETFDSLFDDNNNSNMLAWQVKRQHYRRLQVIIISLKSIMECFTLMTNTTLVELD